MPASPPEYDPPPSATQMAVVTLVCVALGVAWTAVSAALGLSGGVTCVGPVFAVLAILTGTVGICQARDYDRRQALLESDEPAPQPSDWLDPSVGTPRGVTDGGRDCPASDMPPLS